MRMRRPAGPRRGRALRLRLRPAAVLLPLLLLAAGARAGRPAAAVRPAAARAPAGADFDPPEWCVSVHPPTAESGAMRLGAQEAFDLGVRCVRSDVWTHTMARPSAQKYVRHFFKILREAGHRRLVVVMGGGLKLADILKIRAGDLVAWRKYVVRLPPR